MIDTERQLEEQYLDKVYKKLLKTGLELEEQLKDAKENGLAAVKELSEDVRLNFDNYADNLETLSAIEAKNREIDQMNIRNQVAASRLEKVKRLLESPYFGKINVEFLEDGDQDQFYIGIHHFADEERNNLVYDWRSPIAELFYNNTLGPSSYSVNGYKNDVDIQNRRQFIIEKDRLLKYFDSSIAIQDDVLLEALEQDATNEMQDITATIQREQNVIIRDTANKHILVNGIAGSGKTSAIMQRIAYLLYTYRQQITADNILILSPNDRFIEYISNVLPSLGERNPLNVTLLQFAERFSPMDVEPEDAYFERVSSKQVDEQTAVLRSKGFVDHIKQSDAYFLPSPSFFKDLTRRGKVVISKEKIMEIYHTTPNFENLIDKLQATKRVLMDEWESRLNRHSKKRSVQDNVMLLSEEQQQKHFGKVLTEDSEKNLHRYAAKLLNKKYRAITLGIEQNAWIDTTALFKELYAGYTDKEYAFSGKTYTLDEAVIFMTIQHNLVEKISVPNMRFVLIDEVQDYTTAQLSLLMDLFPRSGFTMVGDENQAIFNSGMSFDDIDRLFEGRDAEVKRYDLLNSYRSSGAITQLFKRLATNNKEMDIIPVRKEGKEPSFVPYSSFMELQHVIEKAAREFGSLTIITKTDAEAREVGTVIQRSDLDASAVEVYPINLAKGLEFDNVLLYNVSKDNYVTDRSIKILYTAVSRAMKNLVVTYKDQLPELLAETR